MSVIEKKDERIELRVTPAAKALLTAAAQAKHTNITDFLLDIGLPAAEEAIASPRVFFASEEGWRAVERLLEQTEAQPDEATVAWITKHRRKD